ncbi:hypothetical protein [Mucilaginibacter sp.]|uniref:hypothetical protein n=1 Tax=Mucilaginibacter sp. TaxID=1882438 RepID=UPI003D0A3A58
MNKQYNQAYKILIASSLTALLSFLGIVFSSLILKYITVISLAYALVMSFQVFNEYKKSINWKKARIILWVLCYYPLLRIFIDVFTQRFEAKTFIDGFIIYGGFYELPIIALSLAVLTKYCDGYYLLYRYAYFSFPIGCVITALCLATNNQSIIGLGQNAIVNCFVPVALLAFYPSNKKSTILGWVAIIFIFFVGAKIWSRSYSLVGFYFAVGGIRAFFKNGQKKLGYNIIVGLLACYFLGVFSFFTTKSNVQDSSIADKYQTGSLVKALSDFAENGDFVKLFYWEGNSRSSILVDAFSNFKVTDVLLGKGVFGTYQSFVQSGTFGDDFAYIDRAGIELGWANEAFRWGVPYIIIVIWMMVSAYRKIKKDKRLYADPFTRIVGILIIIKVLDAFVYGIPETSVYNLLMYVGIMKTVIVIN